MIDVKEWFCKILEAYENPVIYKKLFSMKKHESLEVFFK